MEWQSDSPKTKKKKKKNTDTESYLGQISVNPLELRQRFPSSLLHIDGGPRIIAFRGKAHKMNRAEIEAVPHVVPAASSSVGVHRARKEELSLEHLEKESKCTTIQQKNDQSKIFTSKLFV